MKPTFNSSGDLVESYAIDAFGNVKVFDNLGNEISESTLNNIFFQGRDFDDDVGLYYYRNRWYSSELGAFVSRDPLRYEAGDINLHRLIGNQAMNALDPFGLIDLKGDVHIDYFYSYKPLDQRIDNIGCCVDNGKKAKGYTIKVEVVYSAKTGSINIPQGSGSNFQSEMNKLISHENGHVELAKRFNGKKTFVESFNDCKGSAKAMLKEIVKKYFDKRVYENKKLHNALDHSFNTPLSFPEVGL